MSVEEERPRFPYCGGLGGALVSAGVLVVLVLGWVLLGG